MCCLIGIFFLGCVCVCVCVCCRTVTVDVFVVIDFREEERVIDWHFFLFVYKYSILLPITATTAVSLVAVGAHTSCSYDCHQGLSYTLIFDWCWASRFEHRPSRYQTIIDKIDILSKRHARVLAPFVVLMSTIINKKSPTMFLRKCSTVSTTSVQGMKNG